MSIFVIGDRNTVMGLSWIGVEGKVPSDIDQAFKLLDEILERENIELLLITRNWAFRMDERVEDLKMSRLRPLVMEIPDGSGKGPEKSIGQLVAGAVGVKL